MEKMSSLGTLVDADWLQENFGNCSVKIVDASWFMPGSDRDGYKEWLVERIPGSVFFDFDGEIKDQSSPLPHMLPGENEFAEAVGKLGISNTDTVIVYDSQGIFSAPRVWWMFKAMGHETVAVLNGGLPAWKAVGGVTEGSIPEKPIPTSYQATIAPHRLICSAELTQLLETVGYRILDARPSARFYALQPEPRLGVRAGHMPGANNLPFAEVLDNGSFKDQESLKSLFSAFIRRDDRIITTCGSGVTACILALALEYSLGICCRVYDGSWSEWGSSETLPVVTE